MLSRRLAFYALLALFCLVIPAWLLALMIASLSFTCSSADQSCRGIHKTEALKPLFFYFTQETAGAGETSSAFLIFGVTQKPRRNLPPNINLVCASKAGNVPKRTMLIGVRSHCAV